MRLNLLKAARIKNSLKQEDVALKLGISESAYSKKESGKADFSLKQLIIVKEMFNLTLKEFEEIFLKQL